MRIILNPDHIRVRKMFGSWQLNYSDITSVCMGGVAWSGSAFTKDVLYLHTKDGLRDINPSLFSNSDLAKVFDALESHNLRIKTINAWMCRYTVKKIREEQRKKKEKGWSRNEGRLSSIRCPIRDCFQPKTPTPPTPGALGGGEVGWANALGCGKIHFPGDGKKRIRP